MNWDKGVSPTVCVPQGQGHILPFEKLGQGQALQAVGEFVDSGRKR